MILNNISRMERLIGSVSDITQLDHGIFKLDLKEVDLYTFLEEELNVYQNNLGPQLQLDFPDSNDQNREFLNVKLDPRRISQVIGNLMHNAIKYTSNKDREIVVSLSKEENQVKIDIIDNGIGINPDIMDKIFQPFVSFHTGKTAQGSDIGLFLSKKIIEEHDGRISVFSEGENQGSTFTVNLPIKN